MRSIMYSNCSIMQSSHARTPRARGRLTDGASPRMTWSNSHRRIGPEGTVVATAATSTPEAAGPVRHVAMRPGKFRKSIDSSRPTSWLSGLRGRRPTSAPRSSTRRACCSGSWGHQGSLPRLGDEGGEARHVVRAIEPMDGATFHG